MTNQIFAAHMDGEKDGQRLDIGMTVESLAAKYFSIGN